MCADLDLSAKFIHESEVNRLHKGDTLLLPNTYALEADVVESIDMFVKNGGTVIADGMCAMKDRYGVMAHESLKKISNVFGAQVEDIKAIEAPVLSLSDCEVKGWFYRLNCFPPRRKLSAYLTTGNVPLQKTVTMTVQLIGLEQCFSSGILRVSHRQAGSCFVRCSIFKKKSVCSIRRICCG